VSTLLAFVPLVAAAFVWWQFHRFNNSRRWFSTGELIFWEPMITFDFLGRTSDACFEIRQPAAYQKAGYYPTRYCIRTHAGTKQHTVSLEGFVYARAG